MKAKPLLPCWVRTLEGRVSGLVGVGVTRPVSAVETGWKPGKVIGMLFWDMAEGANFGVV